MLVSLLLVNVMFLENIFNRFFSSPIYWIISNELWVVQIQLCPRHSDCQLIIRRHKILATVDIFISSWNWRPLTMRLIFNWLSFLCKCLKAPKFWKPFHWTWSKSEAKYDHTLLLKICDNHFAAQKQYFLY